MSVLLIHEHGRYFHLLISSLIYLFKDLKYLHASLSLAGLVTRGYFVLFEAIVEAFVSLNSFLVHLSFAYRKVIDFHELIFIPLFC